MFILHTLALPFVILHVYVVSTCLHIHCIADTLVVVYI